MIRGMKIALQAYSVRGDMSADFIGTLKKIKQIGYEGIEFAGLYGYAPETIRDMLKKVGLEAVSAHVPLNELIKNTGDCVAQYSAIGCQYIAVPWLDAEDRPGTSGWNDVCKNIEMIATECKKQGITLLYHNHDFEFLKIDGEYALDRLYKDIPALQTEIDTCWVKAAGENPADYVRQYTGRSPVVHLKDFLPAGVKPPKNYGLIEKDEKLAPSKNFEFRPLGAGVQDIPSIVIAAEDAGASWVVVEQDSPSMGKAPMECAELSLKYLKTIK